MSDEPKKYPADTPVTLGMLEEILKKGGYPSITRAVQTSIEPLKPQPKDDELWLCDDADLGLIALWHKGGKWFSAIKFSRVCGCQNDALISPRTRLIPPEEEA
jgi:hypothetical protein